MGGLMIWICAYRDWAKEIYHNVSKDIECSLIESRLQLKNSASSFGKNDKIFFLGWSWKVPIKLINNLDCICLHPSPLPKYRGGSPIQHQILNNESVSAVTYFKMNEDLDTGPIMFQKRFSLEGSLGEIFNRISEVGKIGLLNIVQRSPSCILQDETKSTLYKRRTPEQSEIKLSDFSEKTAEFLYNKIRALQDPYPNAFIVCADGKKIFIKVAYCEK